MAFYIKRNDTSPEYQAILQDSTGTAVSIVGATVRFHLYLAQDMSVKVDAAATIVDDANGVVKYTWQSGDTDTAGWYFAEFEVTYSDTSVETFPNSGYSDVIITADLA